MLAQASDMQPSNPQARFQRANVLITLERYEDALTELTAVRNSAPRESAVPAFYVYSGLPRHLRNKERG